MVLMLIGRHVGNEWLENLPVTVCAYVRPGSGIQNFQNVSTRGIEPAKRYDRPARAVRTLATRSDLYQHAKLVC